MILNYAYYRTMDYSNFQLLQLAISSLPSVSFLRSPLIMVSLLTFGSFTDCAKAMGFIAVPDCNAPDAPPEGVTTLSLTLSRQRERVSSFEAFLPKKIALERRNLTICTNALVSRIVFTEEKGLPRTEKILFKSSDQKSDNIYSVKINKEVIVCSGAVGSPQVLMLRCVSFFGSIFIFYGGEI